MLQISGNQIKEIADIIEAMLYKEERLEITLINSSIDRSSYGGDSLYLYFRGDGSYYDSDRELTEAIMNSDRLSEIGEILLPQEIDSVEASFHYEDWQENFDGEIVYWYYFSVTIYFK